MTVQQFLAGIQRGMKRLCSILLVFLMILAPVSAETLQKSFAIKKEVLNEAIATNDFKIVFEQYFLPSLNDNMISLFLFGAELNISNGTVIDYYGERHMFGRLESAESVMQAIKTGDNRFFEDSDTIYNEIDRLLFGPWYSHALPNGHAPARKINTTMEVVRPIRGKTLSLIDGTWSKNVSDWAIRIEHSTEFFWNTRVRYLSLDYAEYDKENYVCQISILR